MTRRDWAGGSLRAVLLAPESPAPHPVVYTHLDPDEGAALCALPGVPACALVCVRADWDLDLSPWPAPRAFRGGRDFGGGADAHLRALCAAVPEIEGALGYSPSCRCVAGYSLDGLFALWALWQSALFARAASVSGSLWYDGFVDRLAAAPPRGTPERVYFSLGEREAQTKNARLARVALCTERAAGLTAAAGADTVFERNPGGHFADVPERMARALRRLLR